MYLGNAWPGGWFSSHLGHYATTGQNKHTRNEINLGWIYRVHLFPSLHEIIFIVQVSRGCSPSRAFICYRMRTVRTEEIPLCGAVCTPSFSFGGTHSHCKECSCCVGSPSARVTHLLHSSICRKALTRGPAVVGRLLLHSQILDCACGSLELLRTPPSEMEQAGIENLAGFLLFRPPRRGGGQYTACVRSGTR